MATVTLRIRRNVDHSVTLDKQIAQGGASYWRPMCCCGWRGSVTVRRHLAVDESEWHVDNHVTDRWLVWLMDVT